MDLDLLFHALSDTTRRRLLDELAERDGQTLFELHVRLLTWQQASLLRTEWRWRSKHHFLVRTPLREAWKVWLGPIASEEKSTGESAHEDRADECAGG
jgi:DNA-binding transcriptional ArsR family regulator